LLTLSETIYFCFRAKTKIGRNLVLIKTAATFHLFSFVRYELMLILKSFFDTLPYRNHVIRFKAQNKKNVFIAQF